MPWLKHITSTLHFNQSQPHHLLIASFHRSWVHINTQAHTNSSKPSWIWGFRHPFSFRFTRIYIYQIAIVITPETTMIVICVCVFLCACMTETQTPWVLSVLFTYFVLSFFSDCIFSFKSRRNTFSDQSTFTSEKWFYGHYISGMVMGFLVRQNFQFTFFSRHKFSINGNFSFLTIVIHLRDGI